MLVYEKMVSFNQWHLRLMKCGLQLINTHCVKFRHREVCIVKVPEFYNATTLKTAHSVWKCTFLSSFSLIAG